MSQIVIRADASSQIGTGHVMRCLALAHAARTRGLTVSFVCAELLDALEERLLAASFPIHRIDATPGSMEDAEWTSQLARDSQRLVLDGYRFDDEFEAKLKANLEHSGTCILAFDDEGRQAHGSVDVILNQNHGAEQFALYYSSTATQLLGSRFALLRPEFLKWQTWERKAPERISRILVTFGGSGLGNHSLKVLQALEAGFPEMFEIRVIVGAANPHIETLQLFATTAHHQIELCQNVFDMPTMLVWAEFAISAAGSTVWELAFMNVPALIAVVAQNQLELATAMDGVAGMQNLGWITELDQTRLATVIQNAMARAHGQPNSGRQLIDGFGAERVLAHLENDGFWLRSAKPSDARQVWNWANDPEIRQVSFNSDPIPWDSHQPWFTRKLEDDSSVLLIACKLEDDTPFGLIRFDQEADEAVVSVMLDSQSRGHGLGSRVLERATQRLFATREATTVRAYIKTDNPRSHRAFARAGYADAVEVLVQGSPAWCLRSERSPTDAKLEPSGGS
jgi:UDP-2,4-diacetamido-2,4,6-trideoxy-beta-L-altropyranose hydrolase